jgi:hypothetical protein
MTGERSKLNAYEDKLQNTCDENALTYRIYRDKYPISMTIRPAGGMDNQLSMLEKAEDNGYTSPDASLVFAYRDGALEYRMSETLTIGDALFNKLKNLFKSWLFMWLLLFNREAVVQQHISHEAMTLIIGRREEKKPGADNGAGDAQGDEEPDAGDETPDDDIVFECEHKEDGTCSITEKCGVCCHDCQNPCTDICQTVQDFAQSIVGNTGEDEDVETENDEADSENDIVPEGDEDGDDGEDAGDNSAEPETGISSLAEEAALVEEAITVVRKAGFASTKMLQKSFNIGYAKASRLIDALEARGIIGPFNGSSPREVLPEGGSDE